MPYIEYDPENGRYFHVDLASWVGHEKLMRELEQLKSLASLGSSTDREADEPLAPLSDTLEEAIEQAMALALAREEGRRRDVEALGDSSPANEQAEALAAALTIASRLPSGGAPTPWPFVRRRR
jgi:hypothetical protein